MTVDGSPPGSSPARLSMDESVGQLVSQLTTDLGQLTRQELALAKAELQAEAKKAGKGAGMLGGAAVAGHFVLLFLSITLWWGLGNEIGRAWSALVVAVVWAVIALVLSSIGRREIKQVKGIPQTTETAREIPDALRGNEDQR